MAMRQVVWSRDVKKAEAEAASSRLMWIDVLLNKCPAAGVDTNTDRHITHTISVDASEIPVIVAIVSDLVFSPWSPAYVR